VSSTDQGSDGTMKSVLRSFAVLEAVAESQPIGLSRLSRELSLPKPTVSRILKTLQRAGWAAPEGQAGDVRWTITARALSVGSHVMSQVDLRELARPVITQLGAETDENIHLSVPDGSALVLIDKVQSSRSVQTIAQIGERVPMHLTGSGWAYLSRLDARIVDAMLPKDLAVDQPELFMDRARLIEELAEVRERGYAINPGRWRPDVASIASAVVDRTGRPLAAMSISMPSYRLVAELHEPYGQLVRAATERLGAQL
jgi:IclR family transcriptional regulator, acetate operon repressor